MHVCALVIHSIRLRSRLYIPCRRLLLAHLPSVLSNGYVSIYCGRLRGTKSTEHIWVYEILKYIHTHAHMNSYLSCSRTRFEYLFTSRCVRVCVQCTCVCSLYENGKKGRAENYMQKHKIIVVVKSIVHNREWQRNYQV